ncbi:methionine aminopeptidase [Coemansia reversa NRRL 1564]|uniref:Methionine aminopeptidase n=1 Tax=Coemansia reversa (strain ATCC 12441 / NRRL 1564) TaxID=763665 RepID=A0A2G5BKJ2_COERN|nr:methionine aminopeptidase [Coemansia reversa NRRL 1564]|eukprot:PIA19528.1 methionine aminopeptidase [Coemansia reversa NRRL 1564]
MNLKIPILKPEEIEKIRAASKIARDALAIGGSMVRAGLSTESIDTEVHRFIISQQAYPSCLNYMGFPKSICTSVNNVIAHGIPDSRQLEDGDIINIDVTVYKDGFHGDTSATFVVGGVDKPGMDLVNATRESLELAIQTCGPGVPLRLIGDTIGSFAASLGYSVSEELTGHGVGRDFHQNPLVYHHINDEPGEMQAGMAFTIEPILCQGGAGGLQWPDGWTVATLDGGRSAQFEHTILITAGGVEILTT